MNNNFWGDPDEEPLPDWMNPKTYNQPQIRRSVKPLSDCINEALNKPPVPIIIKEPTNNQ